MNIPNNAQKAYAIYEELKQVYQELLGIDAGIYWEAVEGKGILNHFVADHVATAIVAVGTARRHCEMALITNGVDLPSEEEDDYKPNRRT